MKKIIYIISLFIFSSCQMNNDSLEVLIKKSMQTNNWSLLNDFIGETVKCEMCIDRQTFIKIQNLPNRLDTIHNSLALFDKEIIIREKLPELFADINQFKIESLNKSGKIFKDKNEFEVHIPRKDGTQIDLHFNEKNKLISIHQTP